MERKIILITGGQRSGKSSQAEHLALSLSDHPVYVAMAHIWDDEFRERVRNQYIASKADEVILMVSGIAVKVKSDK